MVIDVLSYLVSKKISYKQVGQGVRILCPFHQEKTPSLFIEASSGKWHCFGCGRGSISFKDFIMQYDGEYVKEFVFVPVRLPESKWKFESKEIRSIDEVGVTFLKARGYSDEDIPQIQKLGIGQYKDVYGAEWLVFPVRKRVGEMGYALRKIGSKEFRLFNVKSDFDFLGAEEKVETVVLVEGLFDWLKLKLYGFNVWCNFGTGIMHKKLWGMKQLGVKEVLVFFDKDAEDKAQKLVGYLSLSGLCASSVKGDGRDPDGYSKEELVSILYNSNSMLYNSNLN